jgi:cytidine deaminase
MKQVSHVFQYEVYESPEDLPETDRNLMLIAANAVLSSHAPYSGFNVGAAVLLENGKIFTGSNQENMSYPAGICAERVAVFAAMSSCPDSPIKTLAITARAASYPVSEPVPPCGMCRQAILEYEMKFSNRIRIILRGSEGPVYIIHGMSDLLPLKFHEKGLFKTTE